MGFQFDARTILELGKELISSDELALYELIKNSIDAESEERINVQFVIYFSRTDFEKAVVDVKEKSKNLSDVTDFIESKSLFQDENFTIFVDMLKNATGVEEYLAILEEGYRKLNKIVIEDTGKGMSLEELKSVYLMIGTRNRRKQNLEGESKLGDKGIGRLSAMRLGNILSVKTCKFNDTHWNKLDIDWNNFNCDELTLVEKIQLNPYIGELKRKNENRKGTIITIYDLLSDWSYDIVEVLVNGKLARFINPFEPGLANKLIMIKFNENRILVPSIPKKLLENAHATCTTNFSIDKKKNISINGKIDYCLYNKSSSFNIYNAEVISLATPTFRKRGKLSRKSFYEMNLDKSTLLNIGNFDLEIYWYNRKIVKGFEGLTENQDESRKLIFQWSGGPMLYRYDFRILPFGDENDDWLGLDLKAFGQSGFKLNRRQVIGRVSINTSHLNLSEQTNREGLIKSPQTQAFTKLVSWIVNDQFRSFINEVDDENKKIVQEIAMNESRKIIEYNNILQTNLDKLQAKTNGIIEKEIDNIKEYSNKLQLESLKIYERIERNKQQTISDNEMYMYQAGLGLMTDIIFHELDRVVKKALDVINSKNITHKTIGLVEVQLTTLEKRITAFNAISTVKRQVKTKFDLNELLKETFEFHKQEFLRHNIESKLSIPKNPIYITAVRGMVLQIFENLLDNSLYWLKKQKIFDKNFVPKIEVKYNELDDILLVWDNGPGVEINKREEIFKPTQSYKPSGTGKGLGLHIARNFAEYHGWQLKMDCNTENTKGRLNGFVLQMS